MVLNDDRRGNSGRKPRKYADHAHYADGPPLVHHWHRERPLLSAAQEAALYAGRRYDDVEARRATPPGRFHPLG
jgi:hypothetical protein